MFNFIIYHVKAILIWIIIFILCLYFIYDNNLNTKNQISLIEQNWQEITLKVNDYLSNKKNTIKKFHYDSYQLNIYPSKFTVKCSSDNLDICKELEKHYYMINGYSLWFSWWDFRIWEDFKFNVDSYLPEEINIDDLLDQMLSWAYFWNDRGYDSTSYEKYFAFKKNDENEKVILNELEIICVEGIKNSIIQWTYDEDNIILNRVKSECSWFSNANWVNLNFVNKDSTTKNNIKLTIQIEELSILYKFFIKDGSNFVENHSESLIVKKPLTLNSNRNLYDKY